MHGLDYRGFTYDGRKAKGIATRSLEKQTRLGGRSRRDLDVCRPIVDVTSPAAENLDGEMVGVLPMVDHQEGPIRSFSGQ
jgi:hypothetical protein